MLLSLLVILAADPVPAAAVDPAPPAPAAATKSDFTRETAVAGVVTTVLALGLAAAIPFADQPQPGTSAAPIALGTAGFAIVALMRPIIFFSVKEKPTAGRNVLRVIGTLTAVLGLASFITGFALRGGNPAASTWGFVGAAGIEALSAGAFSLDALLAAPAD